MKIPTHSWGNYPSVIAKKVVKMSGVEELLSGWQALSGFIPQGNARSYGDSALAETQLSMLPHRFFEKFDEEAGQLTIQAGVLLADILKVIVPRGWFLMVSPGTKLITVGGAIASDVHGKNHHILGCFSESVIDMEIIDADGKLQQCSRTKNKTLFNATCGGQGLTGVIVKATIQLKKIPSSIVNTTTYKAFSLQETFEYFEKSKDASYSVAWIDCLAKGNQLGRSLVSIGEFAQDQNYDYFPKSKLKVPFYLPTFTLNRFTVKAFNCLYFNKVRKQISESSTTIDQFFYPLDSILDWNKIYGKKGFVQYQFILPYENSLQGMQEIIEKISYSKKGSFLAVLKLYGEANENWLSFPMKGYSLALDFKVTPDLFPFLNQLDELVLKHKGRIYLAKDARVTKSVFEKGYPKIDQFRAFREKSGADKKFISKQSQRLGL